MTSPELQTLDIWSGRFRSISLADARRDDCPCCGLRRFDFLNAANADSSISLCGRNAVQIRPGEDWKPLQFTAASNRLRSCGHFEEGKFFSRCKLSDPPGVTLTLFRDGRLLVDGITDHGRAKSICSRFIGT
jgi:hypothetical protein